MQNIAEKLFLKKGYKKYSTWGCEVTKEKRERKCRRRMTQGELVKIVKPRMN